MQQYKKGLADMNPSGFSIGPFNPAKIGPFHPAQNGLFHPALTPFRLSGTSGVPLFLF